MKTCNDNKDQDRDDDMDEYGDDDDVFEDYNGGSDDYLNFPHEEEQKRLDDVGDSYSSVHYSSLDDEGGFFADGVARSASRETLEDP